MKLKIFGTEYQLSKRELTPIIDDYPKPSHAIWGHNRLEGKTALVVGGNSGIGLSVVNIFLREGAYVIAAARRKGELEHLDNPNLEFMQWDISNVLQTQAVIDKIYNRFGHIDIIVNNAGVNVLTNNNGVFEKERLVNETTFIHSVNVIGISEICKAVIAKVKAKDHIHKPKIINVISAGALLSCIGAYFTSKYAILSFTKALYEENKDIAYIYGVCPGEVRTKMIRHKGFTLFSRYAKDKRKAHPDEIGELALMLAGEAGNCLNGQIMVIDGGETILKQF